MIEPGQHVVVFEQERPRLVGLGYRLLGSLTDAEDVVQEAWIRWSGADIGSIERPAAWLTTVVSRLGLDRLRARRRAQIDYVGPWLPEPLLRPVLSGDRAATADPAARAELADSLTTAFLVLLERLSPDERLVLLLVDVFGESLITASDMVGRSHDATRQLAVRARRKVSGNHETEAPGPGAAAIVGDDDGLRTTGNGRAVPTPSARTAPREQLAIATAFVGAVMNGDLDTVRSMLHADVVLTSDGGAHRHAARRPVVGPARVSRFLVNLAKRLPVDPPGMVTLEPAWVNGSPGALISIAGQPFMVNVIDIDEGLVIRQYSIINPDKLASIGRSIELV